MKFTMKMMHHLLATFCALLALCVTAHGMDVDFNREVRPILANHCLKCHGVDDKARKGNLRLDLRNSAMGAAKSGEHAIVPGKPNQSALVRRIFSHDPDELMPPPATKLELSDAQKDVLKRWITAGADYQPHWAFVAPKSAPLPDVKQDGWCRNPIDRFILARLEKERLRPSPQPHKFTLVRRVYLDLIGLPPTPREADAFVSDPAPDAYEKLVDRLLASPHYGERWARRWLDLARYADTNGYEKDRPRSIWPYRDWVIGAMNADMPFDQFTIEQLAGDMLPNATPAQKIATGFHRNTMLNEEGGIDPLEYRYYATVDRVGTTGTTWLGLTVACAQCHSHKYDPITHRDYYQLMAFLNNADEPEMDVPSSEIASRRAAIEQKIAKLTADLPEKFPAPPADVKWETPAATVSTDHDQRAERLADGSWQFTGTVPEKDAYVFEVDSGDKTVDRIKLETLQDGSSGPGRTPHGNFVLSKITVTARADSSEPQDVIARPVKLSRAEADFSQKDFPIERAIDEDSKKGWAIDEPGVGVRARTATFFFDKPVTSKHWTIRLDQAYGRQHVIGHLRLSLGSPGHDDRTNDVRRKDAIDRSFADWEKRASNEAVKWTVLQPTEMKSSKPILTLLDDHSILASGDITKSDSYDLTFKPNLKGITALRLEAMPHDSLPRHGPGLIFYEGPMGDFCLSEITLSADGADAKFAKAAHSFASGGFTAAAAIDGNPQTGWMINGGQGRPHEAVFSLSTPTGNASTLTVHMLFERHFAPALGHFRISVTTDPRAGNPQTFPPAVEAALVTPVEQRSAEERDVIFRRYLEIAPELAAARKEIQDLRNTLPKPTTTLVLSERPAGQGRETHIHHRGEFLSTEDKVQSDVPAFLPPLPAGVSHDRLSFARWLVSPENPLTARVTVNRQWQAFFGRGIVRTTGDFGYQGELPSHPELLDWLAVEFQNGGWSMKKLHRLIVTSATYQQSSRVTPDLLALDPQNVLLARGPRFRVEAEVLRDSALQASGLLSEKLGGPSVFPPQPASVTTEGAYGPMTWNASTGEDRFRRSLYTFTKRTAPFAMYSAFDAPSGDVCTARREVSNSPLQALTLMNDAVFIECAQAIGKTVSETKGAPDEERAAWVFRRCLTRPPEPGELAEIVAFAKVQRSRFAEKELNAAEIAGGKGNDAIERATWTTVARAVLNLDEAMTKD